MTPTTMALFELDDTREVNAVTACALRCALHLEDAADGGVGAVIARAHGDEHLLSAALARIDRGLGARWSNVGARADETLRVARARVRSER